MASSKTNLKVITTHSQNLTLCIDAFLDDKRAGNLTPKSIAYYEYQLRKFREFAESQDATTLADVTPPLLRAYLITLQDRKLKGTSQDATYRALSAWLNWCIEQGWLVASPLKRVSRPKQEKDILPALDEDDMRELVEAADSMRDKAILLCLLDTGMRVSEFVALNIGDYDRADDALLVREGKGRKQRVTYLGPAAKDALKRYLLSRGRRVANNDPLWISEHGSTRLTVTGLQQILKRLSKRSGVAVSPHALRRTFALWCLRNGMDLFTIQKLMGHAGLDVLRRYIAQSTDDLKIAHKKSPPSGRL